MSSKRFSVYGIGNAIMDLQIQIKDSEFEALGLKKGGMQLVDTAEQKQLIDKFHGCDINQTSGGSAANTIIAISQLGGETAYGCMVGNDDFGRYYYQEMEQLGVVLNSQPHTAEATGTCVILVTPDAERTMNTHLGASSFYSDVHVSEECVQDAEWLYIEGYLFSSPNGQSAARRGLELAKKHGIKVAITFSDAFIVENFGDILREAVSASDLIFANIHEAEAFVGKGPVGKDEEQELFDKFKKAAPNAIMTMSARGCWSHIAGEEFYTPAFQVKAIDETGAGDMFAGGVLSGMTYGRSAKDSVRLASFLASRVVSQLGPRIHEDLRSLEGIGEVIGAKHQQR